MGNATHNGKKGGLLKGKRHYAKDGTPLGGIKAIVTDTGQQVELEGGEVIINREASKKHWKELSRINQSAGNGVPILPPDTVEGDTEEYKRGGAIIDFNPNVLPSKWVYNYAKNIKEEYPKVWKQYANVYGNEAFENLGGALKRGYWLDGEEWFYYKWKAFNTKHKGSTTLKDVIAALKWCTINNKGWAYMKSVIEKEIQKQYPKAEKLAKGKKIKGNGVIAKTYKEWLALMKKDNNDHNKNAHSDDVIPFWEWVWEMGAMYGFKPMKDDGGDTIIVRTPNNPPNKQEVLEYVRANKKFYGDEEGFLDESDEERLAQDVAETFNIDTLDAYDYIDEPKMKLGGNTEIITPNNENFISPTFVSEKELPSINVNETFTEEINEILQSVKLPFEVTERLGAGYYGTAFKTSRGTVLKITIESAEAFASYVISKSNFKSQAKVYNVFRVVDGQKDYYFIEKELVKVAEDFYQEQEFPLSTLFGEALTTGLSRVNKNFTDERIIELANDYYLEWFDEFEKGEQSINKKEQEIGLKELSAKKKYIVEQLYNIFTFSRDLEKETGTKGIDFNDVHVGNFGLSGNKFLCFDCISRGHKSFMLGGELTKGIKVESEHKDTLEKLYKHKITPQQAPKQIAKDHLKEDKKYYTKLDEMESKFAGGGTLKSYGLENLKVGDKGIFNGLQTSVADIDDDKIYFVQGNGKTKYKRSYETFAKNWKPVGGTQKPTTEEPKPKFKDGQYVLVKGAKDLLKVATSFKDNTGKITYQCVFVKDETKLYKGGIYEENLLDARATENLPYKVGDSIKTITKHGTVTVSEISEDLYVTYLKKPMGGEVLSTRLIGWHTADVIREIDKGDWVVEKKLPYILGDTLIGNDKTEYLVHDIHTGTTYLQTTNGNIRDYATTKVLELLESGEWYIQHTSLIEKPQIEKPTTDVAFTIKTPTGEPSRLTYLQQMLVRTSAFKEFFGDWEDAAKKYIANPVGGFNTFYHNISKSVDLITLEPRIMYHGTKTNEEFFVFDADVKDIGRPYAYFSRNKEYAENFKTISQRGTGDKEFLYECFLNIRRPFMAIGTDFEIVEEKSDYWLGKFAEVILFDKHGLNTEDGKKTYEKIYKVVVSQIGKYAEKLCGDENVPFWRFMAHDKKSVFKSFLMSHNYDSIEYGEKIANNVDLDNPKHYTMATTIFDSTQTKLGDGRNLDFDKLNPDIRFKDGGNLSAHASDNLTGGTSTREHSDNATISYKDKLGKDIFGDKYEAGGNFKRQAHKPTNNDRDYVEQLISQMKK